MKKLYFIITVLLSTITVRSQETYQWLTDSADLKAITAAREYAKNELKFNTGNDFYSWETDSVTGHIQCRTVKKMYCYVYAYDPKTKKSPLGNAFWYFDTDEKKAQLSIDSLKRLKYEAMLYKTAGTSAAKITSRMLDYSPESIRFLVLHEAVHRHRANNNFPLPYVFEEALCDLVANMYLPATAEDGDNLTETLIFIANNVILYSLINQCARGDLSIKKCNRKIKKTLKEATVFQRDRFGYKVNNAYLDRYKSYCKYYFLLQSAYTAIGDRQKFFETVFNLKGTEEEVAEQLRKLGKP